MTSPRFDVWVREFRESDGWVQQGEGPFTRTQAERIAREIRVDCGVPTKVLPEGVEPKGQCKYEINEP